MSTPTTTRQPLELSRDDIIERLEKHAWHRLQMTAVEFVQAYRAGRLHDVGEVRDMVALLDLLPDDDPLFEAAADHT